MNQSPLEQFKAAKEKLLQNIKDTIQISSELSIANDLVLTTSYDNLLKEHFQIVVVGEFNRGKSYLINALLGTGILPTAIRPTTAALTTVNFGTCQHAIAHYQEKFGIAPKQVSMDELKGLVTALTPESEAEAQKLQMVEVFYPTPLCENGVTIIDTPGVNDLNDQREEVTYHFIPQSDVAILVLDATMPLSHSEKVFLQEKILGNDIKKIFFVLNKTSLVSPSELPEVINYTQKNLQEIPGLKDELKLYAVDAKNALKGKLEHLPPEQYASFSQFEQDLQAFLIAEKGNLMIQSPKDKARRRLKEFQHRITAVNKMKTMESAQLLLKEKELQDLLKRTQERKTLLEEQIDHTIEIAIGEIIQRIPTLVDKAFRDVEVEVYQTTNDIQTLPQFFKNEFQAKLIKSFDFEIRPFFTEYIQEVTAIAKRDLEITSLQTESFLNSKTDLQEVLDDCEVYLASSSELNIAKYENYIGVGLIAAVLLAGWWPVIAALAGTAGIFGIYKGIIQPNEMRTKLVEVWRSKCGEIIEELSSNFTDQFYDFKQKINGQVIPLMDLQVEEATLAVANAQKMRTQTESSQQAEQARLDLLYQRIESLRTKITEITLCQADKN